jgi:hypothetical protein
MILAMAAGVLLSVPFVPPVDAYSMRIYAATIPLNALLVALGVVPALSIVGVSAFPHLAMSRRVAPACGALLVLVAFVGSISLRLLNQPETFAPLPCPPEQVNLYVRMTEGSSIHVVEDKARRQSHVPEVRVSDFRNGLGAYQKWYPSLYAELGNVRAGQELRLAMNLARDRHGQPLWLISDAQATPRTGVARICARLADNKIANFYYAQEIQAVSESNL